MRLVKDALASSRIPALRPERVSPLARLISQALVSGRSGLEP